jgi:hypothetical protein
LKTSARTADKKRGAYKKQKNTVCGGIEPRKRKKITGRENEFNIFYFKKTDKRFSKVGNVVGRS